MNGIEVRNTREALGLTMRALAALAGVSHSTIQRWENGNNIKLKQAERIADALALQMKAHFNDTGNGASALLTMPNGKQYQVTIKELG